MTEKTWIRKDALMERWGITEHELFDHVITRKLRVYDDHYDCVNDLPVPDMIVEVLKSPKTEHIIASKNAAIDLWRISGHWFRTSDITTFETEHDISPIGKAGNTIVRKAQAKAVANMVKRDYPNLTAKEAAQEINARLAAVEAFDKDGKPLLQGYSEKHLMRIIKDLKFKPGKSGRKPQK